MNKFVKISLIAIASLLLFASIAAGITIWLVLTPERLTPIVRKQSEKYIPYPAEIGEVELTLFSTFPHFGIRVNKFAVISPATGAARDTLLKADELIGVMNIKAFWKDSELIINKLVISNGMLNIHSDSSGKSNYGLFTAGPPAEAEVSPGMDISFIDLENIELKNLNISYSDMAAGLSASVTGLSAGISGIITGHERFQGNIDISISGLYFRSDTDKMNTSATGLTAKMSGKISEDCFDGTIKSQMANVSFEYEGEKYLEHAGIKLDIPVEIILSRQLIHFREAFASVNGLGITVSGTLENDAENNNIITDISYNT
jgi:hypothetical protein